MYNARTCIATTLSLQACIGVVMLAPSCGDEMLTSCPKVYIRFAAQLLQIDANYQDG